MSKQFNVKMVRSKEPDEFVTEIERNRNDGFIPVGSPFVRGGNFCIIMEKELNDD